MNNTTIAEVSQKEFDNLYPIGAVLVGDPSYVLDYFRSDIIQAKWEKDEKYGCWVRVM